MLFAESTLRGAAPRPMAAKRLSLVVVLKTDDVIEVAACPICWEHFRYYGTPFESTKSAMADRFAFHLKQRHSDAEIRRAVARAQWYGGA